MTDLTVFLAARLDEDEAVIDAIYGFWRGHGERGIADESYAAVLIPDVDPATRTYILRYGPERALREVQAKRAILERLGEWKTFESSGLEFAVRYLAAVYSDHPDYRREWAP